MEYRHGVEYGAEYGAEYGVEYGAGSRPARRHRDPADSLPVRNRVTVNPHQIRTLNKGYRRSVPPRGGKCGLDKTGSRRWPPLGGLKMGGLFKPLVVLRVRVRVSPALLRTEVKVLWLP